MGHKTGRNFGSKVGAKEGFRKAAAGNVRRAHEHEPRHTDSWMGAEEFGAFYLGAWVPIRSSWILAARYVQENSELWVRFGGEGRETVEGYYPDVSEEEAEAFANAPSKGGHLWDHGYIKNRQFIK